MIKNIIKSLFNWMLRMKTNLNPKKRVGQRTKMLHAELSDYVAIGANCEITKSKIGKYTYLGDDCKLPFSDIGAYCSIASDVHVLVGNHPENYVSTSPVTYSTKLWKKQSLVIQDAYHEEYSYTDDNKEFYLKIGNDVWIASRATLVCGKKALVIGDGAIVRGGALVTKDVPPYAIVQGCPAKIIGYRFNENEIDQLLKIKWWEKNERWMRTYVNNFDSVQSFLERVLDEE